MKNFTIIYLVLVSLLFLTACQKDEDVFIVETENVSSLKIGTVGGLLTDINGNTLANTSVSLKTTEATYEAKTDGNGVFYFRNIDLKEERTYLYAESENHFSGSRVFVPKKGNAEFIHINLIPLVASSSFEAMEGGTIDLPDGVQLNVAPSAIGNDDGTAFDGTVHIANTFFNSNHPKMNLMMPGDLSAINEDGAWQSLATYGMMAIQLSDDNGDQLRIVEDGIVSLRIPINTEQIDSAPEMINLWSYDVENGYWVSYGSAELEGDHYTTALTDTDIAFLTWAVPYPSVNLTTQIQLTPNNESYPNALVEVTVVGSGVCSYSLTDNTGALETTIAANQVLSLKVIGHCEEVIYESEIGPYGIDTKIGPIVIESSNLNMLELNGTLKNCDGEAVSQGYANVLIGNKQYVFFTEVDGSFQNYIDACGNNEFFVMGVNAFEGVEGDLLNFQTAGLVNANDINVCE